MRRCDWWRNKLFHMVANHLIDMMNYGTQRQIMLIILSCPGVNSITSSSYVVHYCKFNDIVDFKAKLPHISLSLIARESALQLFEYVIDTLFYRKYFHFNSEKNSNCNEENLIENLLQSIDEKLDELLLCLTDGLIFLGKYLSCPTNVISSF